MKLLRTIRLDPSDTFVFQEAAEPGEWAVPGTFAFWGTDPGKLQGKARSAFRAGFLGLRSLGRSTLVQIVEATDADRAALVDMLAECLVRHFGAPTVEAARVSAEDEVKFAESLAVEPVDTLVALHRTFEDGDIREMFRTLRPANGPKPLRAFAFLDSEGEDEKTPSDQVDIIALAERD